jgi:hypothetical protein
MTDDARTAGAAPSLHGQARFAGLVYAVNIAAGVFSLAYAPAQLFAGETGAAIVQNVAADEILLRCMIAAELACYVAFLVLALALYRLLAGAGQWAAALMAALAVSSVPFGYANVGHLFEILRLVDSGAGEAAQNSVAAALDRYESGLFVQNIPWGLWLFPFGYLVFRCGFLPRILGILLILRAVGYIAHFVGALLFEGYEATGLRRIFMAPGIAEFLICLWLVFLGARRSPFPKWRSA